MKLLLFFTPPYQPLPFVLAAAVGGILADKYVAVSPMCWFSGVLVTGLLWCLFRLQHRCEYAFVCLFAFCFAVSGFRHHDYYYRYPSNDIGNYASETDQPAAITGVVTRMPLFYPKPLDEPAVIFESSDRTNLTLFVTKLRNGNDWIPVSGYLSVNIYDDFRQLRTGDTVQLFGRFYKPKKPHNPGDYDYAAMLRGRRIRSVFYCSNKNAVTVLQTRTRWSFNRIIETVRRNGIANLENTLSPQTLPMAKGMIFGVRQDVDEEVVQNLLETGTMHIMSISGLHVALTAGIIAFLLRLLNVSRPKAVIVTIVFVVFYLLLTDVRTPAIRATVLVVISGVAVSVNRWTQSANLLSATALVVLAINPTELFQTGAQLSFLAVGCFLWIPNRMALYNTLNPFHPNPLVTGIKKAPENPMKPYYTETIMTRYFIAAKQFVKMISRQSAQLVGQLVLVSSTIWLLMIPLIMAYFHLFTPIAILVNPLMWLPMTASMFFGFAAALCGQIPYLGDMTGFLADISFRALFGLIAVCQKIGGHYYLPGPPVWWNLVFYTGFCLLTFLPVRRPRRFVLICLVGTWITVGLASGYVRHAVRKHENRLSLAVYSVGHGNGVLITTPENKLILCDVGCISKPIRAANVLSNAVWRSGKTHIDTVLITHPDIDHFNGIEKLLDRFTIGTVLISPYFDNPNAEKRDQNAWRTLRKQLNARHIPIRVIAGGDDLTLYGLPQSRVLHPPKTGFIDQYNSNACSIVLRFEHGGKSVMLTGDLDGSEPSAFLRTPPLHTDIVLMPHHGGKSNQAQRLLDWTTPSTLLFSAGKMTYREEKMTDYRRRGFEVHNTAEQGAVFVELKDNEIL
jgi:competence protein ComEC